jgi:hypothetical protein
MYIKNKFAVIFLCVFVFVSCGGDKEDKKKEKNNPKPQITLNQKDPQKQGLEQPKDPPKKEAKGDHKPKDRLKEEVKGDDPKDEDPLKKEVKGNDPKDEDQPKEEVKGNDPKDEDQPKEEAKGDPKDEPKEDPKDNPPSEKDKKRALVLEGLRANNTAMCTPTISNIDVGLYSGDFCSDREIATEVVRLCKNVNFFKKLSNCYEKLSPANKKLFEPPLTEKQKQTETKLLSALDSDPASVCENTWLGPDVHSENGFYCLDEAFAKKVVEKCAKDPNFKKDSPCYKNLSQENKVLVDQAK